MLQHYQHNPRFVLFTHKYVLTSSVSPQSSSGTCNGGAA